MARKLEIEIRASPEQLWTALTTDASLQRKFFQGMRVRSDWAIGSSWLLVSDGDAPPAAEGEILEFDAPRRLVHTCRWRTSAGEAAAPISRITWEILGGDRRCILRLSDEPDSGSERGSGGAWELVLANLASVLETGRALTRPPHDPSEPFRPQEMTREYSIYIRTTPEQLWDAITGRTRPFSIDVLPGRETLELDPPWRIVQRHASSIEDEVRGITVTASWSVNWTIEKIADVCRLTVMEELPEDVNEHLDARWDGWRSGGSVGAWSQPLSSLKSFLETGQQFDTFALLRASPAKQPRVVTE